MATYEIPVNTAPAQAFSVVINQEKLAFRLKTLDGFLYMDFNLNGADVFSGRICKPDMDLLKVFRSFGALGRLIFETKSKDYPLWQRLGVEDKLYYVVE